MFAKILEDQVHVVARLPPSTALKVAYIIDGMALVQMMKSAGASTFGELACKYYASITVPLSQSNCNEVHVVFDQYWESSIKGGERTRRGSSNSLEVHIHNPYTTIPRQWAKYIANPQNKVNLCDFVTTTMSNLGRENMANAKKLIIGGGLKDGERTMCITKTTCKDLEELRSNHEEADTRLLLHAKYATQSSSRIIVQSPDTDVIVLCAVHFGAIACDELWFKTGVKDHLRYIPVHAVSQNLGHKFCSALPAFHALTGCDTTSSLAGVGKKKAWVALCRSEQHQESLGMVGQTATLDEVSKMKARSSSVVYILLLKRQQEAQMS